MLDLDSASRVVAGLMGESSVSLRRIGKGGNSKVYLAQGSSGAQAVAKLYFQRTADGADRLQVEYQAFAHLVERGFQGEVPRPLASDQANQIALYEFIQGEEVGPDGQREGDMAQACDFLLRLRHLAQSTPGDAFGAAAEACFSFEQARGYIEQRLAGLSPSETQCLLGDELQYFLRDEFAPAWSRIKQWAESHLGGEKYACALPENWRTLSPSDFGLHNALRTPSGRLAFYDFEYFGWDDPAKMIADFLLHPAMNLSEASRASFEARVLKGFEDDPALEERLPMMKVFCGMKWCMIFLNQFKANHVARQRFLDEGRACDLEQLQRQQLNKARDMLRRITEGIGL